MHVIRCNYVGEALASGLVYLRDHGAAEPSRNGAVLTAPCPVTTVYREPACRVLFDPVRDANPFLHLFEALWIVAGRNDVAFLSQFVPRFETFSDDGAKFHAAYGHRLRTLGLVDQLDIACSMLAHDHTTRRVVLQIWSAIRDLGTDSKDLPCNATVILRAIEGRLDMTVCNRSNDIILGAYGANVVQFSILQEYICARAGLLPGVYYQISNNYHLYMEDPYWKKWSALYPHGMQLVQDPYTAYTPECDWNIKATPVFTPSTWRGVEQDVRYMLDTFDATTLDNMVTPFAWVSKLDYMNYRSEFFTDIAHWLLLAYAEHKRGRTADALGLLNHVSLETDWAVAARMWLDRRLQKQQEQTA
jgi:Thymidylate synthase